MKVAIYSRKSKASDIGESIDNQITMCKEYAIKFLKCTNDDFLIYEDEGFSGGTVKRPHFQLMLKDAKAGKFNTLICYRLDRISRNTGDFAGLINDFESYNINFVSIKEQFDTTTPMGKAMMYIASVFAQLERDTIAERLRDNFQELAKTGRYLGGGIPLGFTNQRIDVKGSDGTNKNLSRLIELPEQIEIVKLIYEKYVELNSLRKVLTFVVQNDITSKLNIRFAINSLRYILTNTVYVKSDINVYNYLQKNNFNMYGKKEDYNGCGLMMSNRYTEIGSRRISNIHTPMGVAPSFHKGIIDSNLWLDVQEKLAKNKSNTFRQVRNSTALLAGLLKCGKCGDYMRPRMSMPNKKGEITFYYMCETKEISKRDKCNVKNINGIELDRIIINELINMSLGKNKISKAILKDQNASVIEKTKILAEVSKIEKDLIANKNAIKSLIKNLEKSMSELTTSLIFERIGEIEEENSTLKNKLLELKNNDEEIVDTQVNYDLMKNMLASFPTLIQTNDILSKRKLIKGIISRLTWDGESISYEVFGHSFEKKTFR